MAQIYIVWNCYFSLAVQGAGAMHVRCTLGGIQGAGSTRGGSRRSCGSRHQRSGGSGSQRLVGDKAGGTSSSGGMRGADSRALPITGGCQFLCDCARVPAGMCCPAERRGEFHSGAGQTTTMGHYHCFTTIMRCSQRYRSRFSPACMLVRASHCWQSLLAATAAPTAAPTASFSGSVPGLWPPRRWQGDWSLCCTRQHKWCVKAAAEHPPDSAPLCIFTPAGS